MDRYPLSNEYQEQALKNGLELRAYLRPNTENMCEDLIVDALTLGGKPLVRIIMEDFDVGEELHAVNAAIDIGNERKPKG